MAFDDRLGDRQAETRMTPEHLAFGSDRMEAIEDRLGMTGDGPRELPFASVGASGLSGIADSDEAYLSEHWPDAIDRDR